MGEPQPRQQTYLHEQTWLAKASGKAIRVEGIALSRGVADRALEAGLPPNREQKSGVAAVVALTVQNRVWESFWSDS
ncbi:MAG: hypothetical protein ACFBSF_08110 [Leptolyngbyaceae cyanobacterium]